jgi:hypothetical protein
MLTRPARCRPTRSASSCPDKFCISGVWALQKEYIAFGHKKNASPEEEEGAIPKRGRKSALPADVLQAIDELLVAAKPAAVLTSLLARCNSDPELHPKVKVQVSQAKAKLKKQEGAL